MVNHQLYVIAVVLIGTLLLTSAATIYVNPAGNDANAGTIASPVKTISRGITLANNLDVVQLSSGVYTGALNYGLNPSGKNIRISGNSLSTTIIDCQLGGRGIQFTSGETNNMILEKLTIRNCKHSTEGGGGIRIGGGAKPVLQNIAIQNCQTGDGKGSAILIEKTDVTLTNVRILENSATTGAVSAIKSNLTFVSCLFSNNTGTLYGGGLYTYQSYVTMSDTTFDSNKASGSGGAISCFNSALQIDDSEFTNNVAGGDGGAIYSYDQAINPPRIMNSDFRSNKAGGSGGGVYLFAHDAKVQDTYFGQNIAAGSGGGLYVYAQSKSTPKIARLTVEENKAGTGGGIYITLSIPSCFSTYVSNSDFTNNQATGDGAGLYISGASGCEPAVLTSNKFSKNSAGADGGGFNLFNIPASVEDVTAKNNTATSNGGGGFIRLEDATSYIINVTNSDIISNTATTGYAGGLYVSCKPKTSKVAVHKSSVDTNKSGKDGAGLYIISLSNVDITQSIIRSNIGLDGAGVYASSTKTVSFDSAKIESNKALQGSDGGGANVQALAVSVILSQFTDNEAEGGNGGGLKISPRSGTTLSVTVSNSKFNSNRAYLGGGMLFAPEDPIEEYSFTITDSQFNSNELGGNIDSYGAGAALSKIETLHIERSQFSSNLISTDLATVAGAGLTLSETKKANISNTVFSFNKVVGTSYGRHGAALKFNDVGAMISGCTITNNAATILTPSSRGDSLGGALHLVATQVVISLSTISNNSASSSFDGGSFGAAVFATQRSTIDVTKSTIEYNSLQGRGNKGSGFYLDQASTLSLHDVTIQSNIGADEGAGLYLEDVEKALVSNCTISNNKAMMHGGAGSLLNTRISVDSSTMLSNKANSGGALYLSSGSVVNLTNCDIENNEATFAGGVHVLPPNLLFADENTIIENNVPSFYEPHSIVVESFPLTYGDIVPSEIVTPFVTVTVRDYFNKIVENDDKTRVRFKSNDLELTISGSEYSARQGVVEFDKLIFYGKIDFNYTVTISSDIMNSEQHDVTFTIANCRDGFERGKDNTTCASCKEGLYSYNGQSCAICPSGTKCKGDGLLNLKKDFWRPNNSSSSVMKCYFGACKGADRCVRPHAGNLCEECEPGYQKYRARCVRCPKNNNRFWIILGIIFIVVILGLLLYFSQAFAPRHSFGIVLFGQILVVLLATKRHDLHLAMAPFSLELGYCVTIDAFQKIILINLIPIALFTVAATAHVIFFLSSKIAVRKTVKMTFLDLMKKIVQALVFALFFTYVPVTYTNIRYYVGLKLADKQYMILDLSKEIYTKEWAHYLVVPLVSNIIYCIVFPIGLVAMLLVSYRMKMVKIKFYVEEQERKKQEMLERRKLDKDHQTEDDSDMNTLVKQHEIDEIYRQQELSVIDGTFLMNEYGRYSFWVPLLRILEMSIVVALAAGLSAPKFEYYKAMAICIVATLSWFIVYVVDPFANSSFTYVYQVPQICLILVAMIYMATTSEGTPDIKWPFDIFIAILVVIGFLTPIYTLFTYLRNKFKAGKDGHQTSPSDDTRPFNRQASRSLSLNDVQSTHSTE